MTTKEWTPGPWKYRPDAHDDWGIVRAPVAEQGQFLGGIICQAYDPEAKDPTTLAKHREAKTDPWEANARLIAAAPDLLEALEAIDAMWSDDGEGGRANPIDARSGQVRVVWEAVRAAIAKARGEA